MKFEAKVFKIGVSYAVIIPKQYFKDGTLNLGDKYSFELIESKTEGDY